MNTRVLASSPLKEPDEAELGGAFSTTQAPVGRLPARVLGRDELLAELAASARDGDPRVHVLAGLGGSGKTTVALRLAADLADAGSRVWWVDANDQAQLTVLLLRAAQDDLDVPDGMVREALAGKRNACDVFWKAIERKRLPARPLLVFDNADDPQRLLALPTGRVADGNGWVRAARSCMIVITSRDRDPFTWGPLCRIHDIGRLPPGASADVLRDLAPDAPDPRHADDLARDLHHLPLALHLAGSYIGSSHARYDGFASYRQAFASDPLNTLTRRLDVRNDLSDRQLVTRTWELSLDTLTRQGVRAARPLAGVLAQFAGHIIPEAVITPESLSAFVPRCAVDDAIAARAALRRVSIIDLAEDENVRGVRLHPLVAETVRASARDPGRAWSAAVGLVHAASQRLDPERPDQWPLWALLDRHLRTLLERAHRPRREQLRHLGASAAAVTRMLRLSGSFLGAHQLAEAALAVTAALPRNDPALLRLLHSHATILHRLGAYQRAERLYRTVSARQRRTLGPEHQATLWTLRNLASLLADQGAHADSERIYRQVLTAQQRALGADDPDTLWTQHSLAVLQTDRGEYAGARRLLEYVLAIRGSALPPDHPDTLWTRHSLAVALARQGDHESAYRICEEVLDVQRRLLGPCHPATLRTRHTLAELWCHRGDLARRRREFGETLAGRLRTLGPTHPETMRTQRALDDLDRP
ncbi:tetratricopeptide (TPR) repeat protein [Thermocatellispora tengchongensis]|uniref:Tetratricopeptide (TPR) repeat protein n=1 Tax=Thermocatellispora tengchongensis TaxID=1073253 RepID=A0A840P5R8_9ACTN|nr:tetratricopeptide repeat protein [Thermocatellispora tengchongensis]MBB5136664.1 tetratricopeptide (TPR) repeat protein [Thermocatellispora tengchongensis]